ncbi:Crp/Fnr family transcriptional regulator [Croceibacterium ferulae]|uniref:Crp/Fnr family transcriptional regulator n=1 Tax=Croceibacterium ferulae TaxID=1854641 RepID=UPI000EAB55DD|nr:Crp/Fnr family transcriptional regulator [Croceibacterium ferulae]
MNYSAPFSMPRTAREELLRNPFMSNLLLRRLSAADRAVLEPHCIRFDLLRNQRLAGPGEPLPMFLFPEGGILATMSTDGMRTEVGLIGREGMVGIGTILGGSAEMFETFVQVDGAAVIAIPADVLIDRVAESPELRQLLSHYLLYAMLQLSFSIVSRSNQMMEARLARWLLMCHDRMPGDEIPVTHEFLATMISAQRSGVTVTLHLLEGEGLIRANRGRITIRDRAGLETLSGCTYGKPEATYRELLGEFGKTHGSGVY